MKSTILRGLMSLGVAFLLSGCSLFSASYTALSDTSALPGALQNSALDEDWLVYSVNPEPETGLVIYPGGKVEPEAYGRLASDLSEQTDALVVIVPMPLDLAVLGSGRGERVVAAYPNVQTWAIGGHSLGGTMAAAQAFDNPQLWSGLFLLASYPQDKHDFSPRETPVISIIGDRDGLISQSRWQESLELLPDSAVRVVIEGGNHAGFGDYGAQEDDRAASISGAEQHRQTIQALAAWVNSTLR